MYVTWDFWPIFDAKYLSWCNRICVWMRFSSCETKLFEAGLYSSYLDCENNIDDRGQKET